MSRELVFRISPTGDTVVGLYDDNFDWRELGPIEVERATDVRLNKETQEWEVYVIAEDRTLPESFVDRAKAIAHEVEYLNERIDSCPFLKSEEAIQQCQDLISSL